MSVVVKLVVLLTYICVTWCSRNKYCDICVNHTLCIYTKAGASNRCAKYEPSPITSTQRVDIVNKINERRNFIAMGKLHPFPQAANMKKISWSTELANIAQRWVDQCDNSVKPDKADQCRDLATTHVGQNIATVIGPAAGLNVKSLIDMWFMQNIYFTGTVAYYNQSSSAKTNYFTQLIWAETAFVGCGMAKFYIEQLRTVVLRIVCNFAPKGNKAGKPIYVIGLPSTQCSHDNVPCSRFPGLCQRKRIPGPFFAAETSTIKSLLRVLNLSNNSLKRELDPNNFKAVNLNYSEDNDQKNKKTRHTDLNNRYGASKRDSFHVDPAIQSDNYKDHQFTPERGHSRMYHGHQTKKEVAYSYEPIKTYTEQNLRRVNDFTTTVLPYSEQNYRRHYMDGPKECTRAMHVNDNHGCCSTSNQCGTNECTRGNSCQQHNCQKPQNPCSIPCPPKPCQQYNQNTCSVCPCNGQPCCSTPVPQCGHSPKCPYASTMCAHQTPPPPLCGLRRSEEVNMDKSSIIPQPNYYDLFTNLEIKSGERKPTPDIQLHLKDLNHDYPILRRRKDSDNNKQVIAFHDMSQNKGLSDFQESYTNFDSSARGKRDLEEKTFKPFWQVDDFVYKKPTDLKSIRYTTLSNRKRKKGFHQRATFMTSTEPITIQFKDDHRVTEKFLSFDELLHLRKFNDEEADDFYDAGRQAKTTKKAAATTNGKATTKAPTKATTKATTKGTTKATTKATTKGTTKATTSFIKQNYEQTPNFTLTANTPFIRLKHCTRKLTCTWTAKFVSPSGGGSGGGGGGGINGPGIDDIGSRTPPGYVDGCTRTSTCTRNYRERNVYDTPASDNEDTVPEPINPGTGGPGYNSDEDYCERRDLHKRRRDLIQETTYRTTIIQDIVTTAFTKAPTLVKASEHPVTRSEMKSSPSRNHACYYGRLKRDYLGYEKFFKDACFGKTKPSLKPSTTQQSQPIRSTITLTKRTKSFKCPCNDASSLKSTFLFSIFTQIFYFTI